VPPRSIDPTIPRALEAVCLRCMAKDPAARFATAEDLARAIEAAPTAPTSRGRGVGIVIAVVALAGIGGTGAWKWKTDDDARRTEEAAARAREAAAKARAELDKALARLEQGELDADTLARARELARGSSDPGVQERLARLAAEQAWLDGTLDELPASPGPATPRTLLAQAIGQAREGKLDPDRAPPELAPAIASFRARPLRVATTALAARALLLAPARNLAELARRFADRSRDEKKLLASLLSARAAAATMGRGEMDEARALAGALDLYRLALDLDPAALPEAPLVQLVLKLPPEAPPSEEAAQVEAECERVWDLSAGRRDNVPASDAALAAIEKTRARFSPRGQAKLLAVAGRILIDTNLEEATKVQRGLPLAEAGLELVPNHPTLASQRSMLLSMLRKTREARRIADEAVRAYPIARTLRMQRSNLILFVSESPSRLDLEIARADATVAGMLPGDAIVDGSYGPPEHLVKAAEDRLR
jgi:hypothetical protein